LTKAKRAGSPLRHAFDGEIGLDRLEKLPYPHQTARRLLNLKMC
jgi:hypothetical protein